MSVLVVGSVALDSLETPFGKRDDALGGAATYFSTAASLLTPVRLVGVIGEDFPEEHVEMLRTRRIDLGGLVRVPGGKTFRWKGRYGENLNEAQTLDTQLNVFADFSPNLPEHFRDTPFVFLANIHPSLQLRVLEQVRAPKLVAMDTMNFWITGERPRLLEILPRIDVLTVNDGEARLLAGEANVVKAAKAIQKMGVKNVVVKRGEYGALFFAADGHVFWAPAVPAGVGVRSHRRRRHLRGRVHGHAGARRRGHARDPAPGHGDGLRDGLVHRRGVLGGPPQARDPRRAARALRPVPAS
jgi:sugar/nucleoside kinase (ribokinase family)